MPRVRSALANGNSIRGKTARAAAAVTQFLQDANPLRYQHNSTIPRPTLVKRAISLKRTPRLQPGLQRPTRNMWLTSRRINAQLQLCPNLRDQFQQNYPEAQNRAKPRRTKPFISDQQSPKQIDSRVLKTRQVIESIQARALPQVVALRPTS